MRVEDLIVIDLEASGLGAGSWPIEVGLAWVEGGAVKSWSSLIRPEPDWDLDLWDMFAQDIHAIPLSDLEGAPTAWSVAEELLARVAGRPVYSDAPSYDLRWARRLLDAHPSEAGIRILDYDRAVGAVCGEHGANWAYERLERTRTTHRAGPDAARMVEAILYGIGRSSEPAEPGSS